MKDILYKYETRIQTGAMLAGMLATIMYINSQLVYTIALWAITMLAIYEAKYMLNMEDMTFVNVAVTLVYLLSFWINDAYLLVILAYIVALSLSTYLYVFEKGNMDMLGYPILGISFLLSIVNNFPPTVFLFLIFAVSFTDIGAFIVGKAIGKTQLSEISPNKTVEGSIGGVIIGTTVAGLFAVIIGGGLFMIIIAFFVSLASIFGDLYESSLKRKADMKDSGSILPGHGGVLDRIDGYLFSAPVLFVFLKLYV